MQWQSHRGVPRTSGRLDRALQAQVCDLERWEHSLPFLSQNGRVARAKPGVPVPKEPRSQAEVPGRLRSPRSRGAGPVPRLAFPRSSTGSQGARWRTCRTAPSVGAAGCPVWTGREGWRPASQHSQPRWPPLADPEQDISEEQRWCGMGNLRAPGQEWTVGGGMRPQALLGGLHEADEGSAAPAPGPFQALEVDPGGQALQ